MLEVTEAQKLALESAWKNHPVLKEVEAELITDPEAYYADMARQIEDMRNGAFNKRVRLLRAI